mgnify:CR=1 FL=1
MFWPLSAFFRQKVSLFDRFTFGRGYAFTFQSGEDALVGAAIKAHKKTAHEGRLVYMLFTCLAIGITSSAVARRRSLRLIPHSLAFTVTPLLDLPRAALKTL